jgi:hypothetical protein
MRVATRCRAAVVLNPLLFKAGESLYTSLIERWFSNFDTVDFTFKKE